MTGNMPNTGKDEMQRHDRLVQEIPPDLSGAVKATKELQGIFKDIHKLASKIAKTAFDSINKRSRDTKPDADLLSYMQAVLALVQDLAKSTLPNAPRHLMTYAEVASQGRAIGDIASLAEKSESALAELGRSLHDFRAKLKQLEEMYRVAAKQ
jgi:hypothetical protein